MQSRHVINSLLAGFLAFLIYNRTPGATWSMAKRIVRRTSFGVYRRAFSLT